MKRREFIAAFGSAAVCPLVGRSQEAAAVIGFLSRGSPGPFADQVAAFRQGLRENGYLVGQNVTFDFR